MKIRKIVTVRRAEPGEANTKWRKMFPIEHVIQFNLEHRGDYVSVRLTFDRGEIMSR